MCRFLNIPRSLVYYVKRQKSSDTALDNMVVKIFRESRNNYGTEKIKKELSKLNMLVSRRKIGRIMRKYALVSNYTIKNFKVHRIPVNEENLPNIVDRQFDGREDLEVIVSDLTYVRVGNKWHYICLIINLYNRKILGFSSGANKTSKLVLEAFMNSQINLSKVQIFHTDRGSEFKNRLIKELLDAFEIKLSLSKKGTPYDNAVAEQHIKS